MSIFSKIFKRGGKKEETAAGTDAETVSPTRSPRYALAAPNTTASSTPSTIAVGVSSFGEVDVPDDENRSRQAIVSSGRVARGIPIL